MSLTSFTTIIPQETTFLHHNLQSNPSKFILKPGYYSITTCNNVLLHVKIEGKEWWQECKSHQCNEKTTSWTSITITSKLNSIIEIKHSFLGNYDKIRPRLWYEDSNSTSVLLSKSPLLSNDENVEFYARKWGYKGIGFAMDVTGGIRSMRLTEKPFISKCSLKSYPEIIQDEEWFWINAVVRDGRFWILNGLIPLETFLIIPLQKTRNDVILHHELLTTMKSKELECDLIYNLSSCPYVSYNVPFPKGYKPQLVEIYNNLTHQFEKMKKNLNCSTKECEDCFEDYKRWSCSIYIPRCTDLQDSSWWDKEYTYIHRTNLPSSISFQLNSNPKIDYKQILPCISLCQAVESCGYIKGFKCQRQVSILPLMNGKSPACNRAGMVGNGGWWERLGIDDEWDDGKNFIEKDSIWSDLKNVVRSIFGISKPMVVKEEEIWY